MKWSLTGGLESDTVGFNLLFGHKSKATKTRLLWQQNMHNLQRKYEALRLPLLSFFNCCTFVEQYVGLLLPPAVTKKGPHG